MSFVMPDTKSLRPRGRPRGFDTENAVATAADLFRARGFDAVSIADVTNALGINPPSFYSAFGSKQGLYTRVLEHYAAAGAIPLDDVLRPDRPVADNLAALLEEAARHYATNPEAPGCLVVEGTRCNDAQAREVALAYNLAVEARILDHIAERHAAQAAVLTDFVATSMFGLSAKARNGHGLDRLLATARLAGSAIQSALIK
jgi:TetR/AcrR family transcriptional regulator, repressor for divergent bdcA